MRWCGGRSVHGRVWHGHAWIGRVDPQHERQPHASVAPGIERPVREFMGYSTQSNRSAGRLRDPEFQLPQLQLRPRADTPVREQRHGPFTGPLRVHASTSTADLRRRGRDPSRAVDHRLRLCLHRSGRGSARFEAFCSDELRAFTFLLARRFSEQQLRAELNVARRADGSVPGAKRRAGDVVHERQASEALGLAGKDVPVPDVEELGAELNADALRDAGVFHQTDVVVVEPVAAQVADARPVSKVELKALRP